MRVGLQVHMFDWPGGPPALAETLDGVAREAEGCGFHSIWLMDHFFQMGGPFGDADAPMLEGWSTLAYLAAITDRIELGTLVTGVTYRPPGLTLKTLSTLDVLSGGRAWLGVGAGWYQREADGLGLPLPPLAERFERLDEFLRIARRMRSGSAEPFAGRFTTMAEPIFSPMPLRTPPIMIGGEGERRTLRLVAEHADASNLFAGHDSSAWPDAPQRLRRKIEILERHCADVGRDPAEITNTVLISFDPNTDPTPPLIELLDALADLGVTLCIFNTPCTQDREVIAALADTVIDRTGSDG